MYILPYFLYGMWHGITALLWASQGGHLPLVRKLVNAYEVNVFQKDKA